MMLIDVDWVLGRLKPYEQSDEEWSVTGGTAFRLIHRAVDNAPTVDAVVVTRCKDCKYYKPDEYECGCDFAGGLPHVKADDFCSYGEPKEE